MATRVGNRPSQLAATNNIKITFQYWQKILIQNLNDLQRRNNRWPALSPCGSWASCSRRQLCRAKQVSFSEMSGVISGDILIPTQHYTSLHAVVMICAGVVNTHRQILSGYRYVWLAWHQLSWNDELSIKEIVSSTVSGFERIVLFWNRW